MSRAVVIQHLAPEGPAGIAAALTGAGVEIDVVRVDLGQPFPEALDGIAGLVVMGGPMSARSDDGFPTRRAELALLRRALRDEVPVLGVCLGAQLLASAAGGSVRPGHGPEIGWGPVELTPAASEDPLLAGLPRELIVLHWHGETYEAPVGAVRLAGSEAYDEQAFRVGPCAWGLQFHVEAGPGEVGAFVEAFPEDAAAAVGGGSAIRAATADAVRNLGPYRDELLGRFAAVVAARG